MHEVSQRWALTMSVIAAIEGVVALVVGAFLAPIPTGQTSATQVATALFIRGFLALIALVVAFSLAYYAGYRIQMTFEPTQPTLGPVAASSPLVALFTTPGPRRDALYTGGLTLIAYWFFTTIYIAALGRTVGNVGLTGSVATFIFSRLLQGVALAAAGGGAGALGARNAVTRLITRRVFAPVTGTEHRETPQLPAPVQQHLPADDSAPPSDG